MESWQETLLAIDESTNTEQDVFRHIESAAKSLGFDNCAYGIRLRWPFTSPKILMLNNYSSVWQNLYLNSGYLLSDPTIAHGCISQRPLVWSEDAFSDSLQLWEDARAHGIAVGWSQSIINPAGVGGMLSLSRSHDDLTITELQAKEARMRWLVNAAHLLLSKIMLDKFSASQNVSLTPREIEVLKWTADGKSAQDIADILNITKHVVDFHIKNSISKLQTANKTAAVIKAAMLGLLN